MDEGRLMTDLADVTMSSLAGQIADLRSKAEAHAQSLSHLHGQLRVLEAEMTRRQTPPDDWE